MLDTSTFRKVTWCWRTCVFASPICLTWTTNNSAVVVERTCVTAVVFSIILTMLDTSTFQKIPWCRRTSVFASPICLIWTTNHSVVVVERTCVTAVIFSIVLTMLDTSTFHEAPRCWRTSVFVSPIRLIWTTNHSIVVVERTCVTAMVFSIILTMLDAGTFHKIPWCWRTSVFASPICLIWTANDSVVVVERTCVTAVVFPV